MERYTSSCSFHYSEKSDIANTLIKIYYNYWTNKVIIDKSKNEYINHLRDTLPFIIDKTIEKGITTLILDIYKTQIPILGIPTITYFDDYGRPIASQVQVSDLQKNIKIYYVINYNLTDLERETYIKLLGWKNVTVYKCIHIQLNKNAKPLLCDVQEILRKISCLSYIEDKNLDTANIIFKGETQHKLSPEQACNISAVITNDRRGIILINQQKNEKDEAMYLDSIKTDLVSPISNWPNIKDAYLFHIENFFKFTGLMFETQKTARQNLIDSSVRYSIKNSFEDTFIDWIEKFIDKYNEYYNVNISFKINNTADEQLEDKKYQLISNFNNTNNNANKENITETI